MQPDKTTLGEALGRRAADHPEKVAIIGQDRALTWAELDAEVNRVARLLAALGIEKGDAMGLCASKRPELVVVFLALSRLGAIAAPVNFKLEAGRIISQFETGRIRSVLLEDQHDDVVKAVAHLVGDRVLYLDRRGRYDGRLYAEQASYSADTIGVPVDPHDVCYFNYTSGTTGNPKGATGTHANVLWNGLSGREGLGLRPDDVFMCMFSVFSHPHELFNRALITGSTMVVVDTMSPRVVCQLIQDHRITWMMAVPSFYEMMLAHIGRGQFDVSSLRVLESGGAWVSPDTLERLEDRFGCGFMPVWGSTEANGVALAMRPDEPRKAGATGRPVAYYEVGVFDDHGRPVPDGETGEMWVRGPCVSAGYIHQPEETAAAFRDGWYRTSDLVRRDADGFYFFVGRKHDMLKVGGIRVFPLEIEQVLIAHPEIDEAVVVRAEERVRGEVPRAVVRIADGSTLSVNDVKAWCREHMAVYKVPRFVEFWADIPKLPNGKIDRKAVEARAPAEAE